MRTLNPEGLDDLWARYDNLFKEALDRIKCGDASITNHQRDSRIYFLPIRYGGMGFTSHAEIVHMAWHASQSLAHRFIETLYNPLDQSATRFDGVISQKEMCIEYYDSIADTLINGLNDMERTAYYDNLNSMGNAALYAIPKNKGMSLDDREMATLLHVRTLQPGSPLTICNNCGENNHLAHDLSCRARRNHNTERHHYVNKALNQYLQTLNGTETTKLEPTFPNNDRGFRTDLYIKGRTAPNQVESEIDLKITSLLTANNINHTNSYRVGRGQALEMLENETTFNKGKTEFARIRDYIISKHEEVKNNHYRNHIRHHFMPFLMTTGGHLSTQASKWLSKITKKKNLTAFNFFEMRVGVYLVKARAITFNF
jgi:hypothetical protein